MIKAEYDDHQRIMRFTLTGRITLSMMVGASLAWMKSIAFRPDAPVLWDLRNSDWSPIHMDFRIVGKDVVAEINRHRTDTVRVAWVVDTATESSLIDVIYASQSWKSEWRAFTSTEDAIAWIREPSERRAAK